MAKNIKKNRKAVRFAKALSTGRRVNGQVRDWCYGKFGKLYF